MLDENFVNKSLREIPQSFHVRGMKALGTGGTEVSKFLNLVLSLIIIDGKIRSRR
jgi:hypothetical protein